MSRSITIFAIMTMGVAACGSSGSSSPDAGPMVDAGPADFSEAPAYVRLSERSDNMGSGFGLSLDGRFRRSKLDVYEELAREGGCRQLRGPSGFFCSEPCDGYCVGNEQCMPFPEALSAGTLAVSGLDGAGQVSITPAPGNVYSYYEATTGLPAAGTGITVSAPGDGFTGFELSVPAPERLSVTNRESLALTPGTDLVFEWQPSTTPGARIWLWLFADRGHAQISPAVIECDVADTGRLTIPAAWVDWYSDPANWSCGDCFESVIARYSRATTEVDGVAVELEVRSVVGLYLIPQRGLTAPRK